MRIFSCCLSERVCVALLLLSVAVGCTHSEMQMGSPSGIAPDGYIAPEGLSRIHWLKYYEALGAASRGKGDTLMLYFMMDSCSPCKLMEKRTFNDERVVEALDEFVPVRVRGDVELQMIRRFRVRTFPTIVFASVKEG